MEEKPSGEGRKKKQDGGESKQTLGTQFPLLSPPKPNPGSSAGALRPREALCWDTVLAEHLGSLLPPTLISPREEKSTCQKCDRLVKRTPEWLYT